MDSLTTISQMLSGCTIYVPAYQRAYSWDTEWDAGKPAKQVNQFLYDLQDYVESGSASNYYFGHFLFEQKSKDSFGIIDGQQRLTTISIFVAALFCRLKQLRTLSGKEMFDYMKMVKVEHTYHFSTVDYDSLFFRDYVIDQIKCDRNGLETESQKRIADAYDYFDQVLSEMGESELCGLLNAVSNAACTTHIVDNEAEAIQMFIFQNNRGKKPSNLEIIKAQFMYNVHLYGGGEKEKWDLITEIKNRFEKIYKSISKIEHKINEDDVLTYTQRIYFNSLWESNAVQKVNMELEKENKIDFIRNFTQMLALCFEQITSFFDLEKKNITIHSLAVTANYGIMMPFVIKAFIYKVCDADLERLATALESIFIRARVIGSRADLTSRLNDVFQQFEGEVTPVINRIEWMKTQEGWWVYWNNAEFERALQGWMNPEIAKVLLWKYENYLIENGKSGYLPIRYDSIVCPQLEHIAPQVENPEGGYCEYDEEFRNQYLNCIGNYLLLSGHHNSSIGNVPFEQKRATYTQLHQQQEIRELTEADCYWDKEKIARRKAKIVDFLLHKF